MTMSAVSLGCTQPPPGGFRGERCYILWRTVPKQKPMRQAFAPDKIIVIKGVMRQDYVGAI